MAEAKQKVAMANSVVDITQQNMRLKHNPEHDVTVNDLCEPDYWAVVNERLRNGDIIEVHGNGYWAELLVRQGGRGFVPVVMGLRSIKLPPLEHAGEFYLPKGFKFIYDEATGGWWVQRESDGARMTPTLPNQKDVYVEVMNHATLRGK